MAVEEVIESEIKDEWTRESACKSAERVQAQSRSLTTLGEEHPYSTPTHRRAHQRTKDMFTDAEINTTRFQYQNDLAWLQKASPEVFAKRAEMHIMEFNKLQTRQAGKRRRQ